MYASAFPFSFPFFNSPVIFKRLGKEDWGEYFLKGGKREPRTSCQSLWRSAGVKNSLNLQHGQTDYW
ncbi:hypothetical protein KOW79_014583 [Hemibagrus wyckioides]|uniref:Uncharacterized protein n=1 Tax=Hemibagrus wyckioides TaxID=337641 RepID=A0A9D3SFD6_9TELE|nr:hypothetical protein KOW79_014583 [Hemibagrus wyckioides]